MPISSVEVAMTKGLEKSTQAFGSVLDRSERCAGPYTPLPQMDSGVTGA